MATFRLVFISILMLSTGWAAQNFLPVSVCPRDKNTWKFESDRKNCQGDTPDYLCAAIENQVGNFGEICTKFGLTPVNKCAVLNEQTHNLDSVDCKAPSGCPSQPYIPSVLWQYQICYEDFYGTTTSLAPTTTQDITSATTNSGLEDSGSGTGVGVFVAMVIILFIVAVVMVVFFVRNQFGFKDNVQQRITNLRKCFDHGDDNSAIAENGEAQSTQVPLLEEDVRHVQENETNSEKPDFSAKHEKTKTKKEKVTNTSNTGGIKEEGPKDKNNEPSEKKIEKLEELLKYLVHILKQELGVNDLKEKVVIHSKSINEHFSEPLIKDLQSLKDINDYSQLDTSLVLALLHNLCEGIKPPTRGWDYEPQDDETHVGADIERIRSMWNKYCDDDFELKNLDEVYNRMKQKYGTVAVLGGDWNRKPPHKDQENTEEELEGDGNKDPVHKDEEHSKGLECMRIKIQSIKLNPDCTVEKGIVITENISTALKTLRSKNVVILKGVIGCGKTHALKVIKNHFQERNWKTVWVESENLEGEISHEKPTIFLLDNLFGKFGASVFSQDAVNKTEKALKVIESSKEESKVVIGIHTHVYDEVKKNLKLNFLHQKNITVEMDNLSEAETLLIFKKQLTNGHCEMNPNCWFKTIGFQSVLDKLLKNQGHVGGPFLSLMYCNQHELFSDEAFSVNPVQTLMQYMGRMRHDSPKLYHCLVYLMCVQQYNCEEEPEEWAGEIYVDITKDNFMDLAKTSGLLQVENKRATLAHELLTTVLFKSAMESEIIIKPVLQRCKIDVILQLLRPTDSTQSDLYLEFTYTESSQTSKNAGKLCAYRLAQICTKQEINHPLMKIEFFKKKCAKYLKHGPKQLKGPK